MKYRKPYEELAEDFIAMMDEQPGGFAVTFAFHLINRSKEMPTSAKPEQLLHDVLEEWIERHFVKITSFRVLRHIQPREIPSIVEAIKPLCSRAFPILNTMLAMDRDYLFPTFAYVEIMGSHYVEEAPSVTFVHYLNTMERLRCAKSEIYERNVLYVAEVHALNRAAKIMPRQFHRSSGGRLQPGQTYAAMKEAERRAWREKSGIHDMTDLLEHAGLS